MKSVQIRSYLWSVFFCIRTEYLELLRKSPYSVRIQENTDQNELRIWTLFTLCQPISCELQSQWPSLELVEAEAFLRKSALKICSKFTGEHPCRSAISIKLLSTAEIFSECLRMF